jgi:hypothetical protein
MSRINYAFASTPDQPVQQGSTIRSRVPLKEKVRDRKYLRMAMEATGLFLFGFGTTSLVTHIFAGDYFSRVVSLMS